MFQSERLSEIMRILKKYHYVTVEYLVEQIRYSPASIRRDLTMLEKQGLVKRSYGGVEIKEEGTTPFMFRQHVMKVAKNSIAEQASKLVNDGDTVFLDGSSSAQYMGHYLLNKKDLMVVTNNMTLASYLSEGGVKTYCTGGYVSEIPGILAGEITNNVFSMFHADIMFFSTNSFNNGLVYESNEIYYRHHRIMLDNSDTHVALFGSDKIGKKNNMIVCTLDEIDYFISDSDVPDELIKKYSTTEFISV